MKRPLIVQSFVNVGWFVRCMVTGRMWMTAIAPGDTRSERWRRSEIWAVMRPPWPDRWLRTAPCGCQRSPVTRRFVYYSVNCATHCRSVVIDWPTDLLGDLLEDAIRADGDGTS